MKNSNYNNNNISINDNKKNNINIIPVISYNNACINKSIIYKENNKKSGIYC